MQVTTLENYYENDYTDTTRSTYFRYKMFHRLTFCLSRKNKRKGGYLFTVLKGYFMMAEKINRLYEDGVKLFLCGRPATPKTVMQYVAEHFSDCMPTFFYDKKGRLAEIHF